MHRPCAAGLSTKPLAVETRFGSGYQGEDAISPFRNLFGVSKRSTIIFDIFWKSG